MKTYGIYTRNCAGTTIYHIGKYASVNEAYEEAKREYKWFATNPDISTIIELTY